MHADLAALVCPALPAQFVFDGVFGGDAQQQNVFEEVGKPLVEHVVQGYNACVFAYGQTGR